MKKFLTIIALLLANLVWAQAPSTSAPIPNKPTEDYSGMYAFLREGEFVQITVEDAGRVTGFVSRYGELDSDRGTFLEQFFKEGKLEGKNLSFTTKTVHGIWYEFKGTVERGDGKNIGDEGYYVLKGTLSQYGVDAAKKTTSKSRDVTFKSFPQDAGGEPPQRN